MLKKTADRREDLRKPKELSLFQNRLKFNLKSLKMRKLDLGKRRPSFHYIHDTLLVETPCMLYVLSGLTYHKVEKAWKLRESGRKAISLPRNILGFCLKYHHNEWHTLVYFTQEDSLFMLLMWWKVCPWHHNKPPGKMGPSSLINPITDASFCPRLLKDTTSLSMYPIPSSKGQCTWHATNTQLGPL